MAEIPPVSLPFPVVGIGASAGGLEAITQLLQAMPLDTGMAFVVIQHLAPSRASLLSEIIARATKLPVQTVADGMPVHPNHVYVIPPGSSMELADGTLKLSPRIRSDGAHRPIDLFLRSLAAVQGHRAIAVILSGTANDGTLGCEEIKAEGGITFAQDDTAQQDSMPRSATAAGCVDFVLSPAGIAKEIARIAKHPLVARTGPPASAPENGLGGVLELVRGVTGTDFSHYKRNTLVRRITRRMVLHKVDDIKEYQRLVASTPAEVVALFNDILISVTSFFRNPEVFELLKSRVFPELTKDRPLKQPVRIWVLGCSTGEEAYSIAMAFTEYASEVGRSIPVQVFASDLNSAGIETARAGIYSRAIEQDVSPDRLHRFFTEHAGQYRVVKSIRDLVVFARHNALTDPPFSHINLISCRNLLIYLDASLQQRLIPTLHYSLQPEGYLLLGLSETIGPFRSLFEPVVNSHKLYLRRAAPVQLPGFDKWDRREEPRLPSRGARDQTESRDVAAVGAEPQREADRLLLSRYVPASVLINTDLEILQFRGDTGPYLTPTPGRASLNLLKMLKEGLIVGVRAAVLKAKREERAVRQEGLKIHVDGASRKVSVEVIPVKGSTVQELCFMVVFDDLTVARARARAVPSTKALRATRGAGAAQEIIKLRQELLASREYLQSVIEQQEAANEELQSANEEVQSANEELQSINEELETSKEEIQSSSEELATVNDELNNRNQELHQSHNDLTNLIASVQLPIVMVGPDLKIRRFTPSAEKLLNLIAADIGRPLNNIKTGLDILDLDKKLLEVMHTVAPLEVSSRDDKGRWYSVRLRPYRTLDNKIDGVVLTFVDIDALKKIEAALRQNSERLALLQDKAPLGIRETDLEGRYTKVNSRYCAIVGRSEPELLGHHFTEFLAPEDRDRATRLWQQVMSGAMESYRDERRYLSKRGDYTWVEISGFVLRDEAGKAAQGIGFIQDISERKAADAELRAADRSKNDFLAMLAHELRNPLAPLLNVVQLLEGDGLSREKAESLRGILERQIRNLSRMTDDLLDVSRISQGRMQIQRDIIDGTALVRRAVELFRPTIEAHQQKLHLEVPEEPVYLDADPVRLEQVIDNLLTNASKFTPSRGNIWVSMAVPTGVARDLVAITVRDDGNGIKPEFLPRIFEPFTQGDQSLDRMRGGLGIGLTLVKNVIELHDGTVEAKSAGPGQGSEFLIQLPISPAPARERVVRPRDKERQARRSRRVLIVDDNPDGAETMAMLLRGAGHEVEIAGDGDQAVSSARTFLPEAVLLDIGLPGKDGYQVAAELRSRPETRAALIIVVSGYGQEEDRRRAKAAGIDHYFTKPVDIESLLTLLYGGAGGGGGGVSRDWFSPGSSRTRGVS